MKVALDRWIWESARGCDGEQIWQHRCFGKKLRELVSMVEEPCAHGTFRTCACYGDPTLLFLLRSVQQAFTLLRRGIVEPYHFKNSHC